MPPGCGASRTRPGGHTAACPSAAAGCLGLRIRLPAALHGPLLTPTESVFLENNRPAALAAPAKQAGHPGDADRPEEEARTSSIAGGAGPVRTTQRCQQRGSAGRPRRIGAGRSGVSAATGGAATCRPRAVPLRLHLLEDCRCATMTNSPLCVFRNEGGVHADPGSRTWAWSTDATRLAAAPAPAGSLRTRKLHGMNGQTSTQAGVSRRLHPESPPKPRGAAILPHSVFVIGLSERADFVTPVRGDQHVGKADEAGLARLRVRMNVEMEGLWCPAWQRPVTQRRVRCGRCCHGGIRPRNPTLCRARWLRTAQERAACAASRQLGTSRRRHAILAGNIAIAQPPGPLMQCHGCRTHHSNTGVPQ